MSAALVPVQVHRNIHEYQNVYCVDGFGMDHYRNPFVPDNKVVRHSQERPHETCVTLCVSEAVVACVIAGIDKNDDTQIVESLLKNVPNVAL